MFGILGVLTDAGRERTADAVARRLGQQRRIAGLRSSASILSSHGLIGARPFASIAAVSR